MKKFKLILLFTIPLIDLFCQSDTFAIRFSKLIKSENLKKNLSVIASDEYEGRETGMKGQKMAAEYISKQFKSFGIPPLKSGYYQPFNVVSHKPQQVGISVNGKKFLSTIDYYSPSSFVKDSSFSIKEITFAGYGINSNQYNDYSFQEKATVVMISDGEPFSEKGISFISNSKEPSDWSKVRRKKISEARKSGVKILIIVEKDIQKSLEENAHRIYYSRMTLEEEFNKDSNPADIMLIHISTGMADQILKSGNKNFQQLINEINKTGKPLSTKIKTDINLNVKQTHEVLPTENVLGFIEGSDLKSEVLVVTAHYDHIGKEDGKVYNGADDDGSGTVGVIELANAFMQAKKQGKGPRRSILFMTVAGEEKGLLGSDYYTRHPIFELKNTIANLNIDMIGRIDKEHEGNPNYIYIIGSNMLSKELHQVNEECNTKYVNLKLDYTYNKEDDPNRYYYRSDHYNFAKNNIPVIFYFNGVHEDYHQETDEVEKINFNKMEKITRLIFFTAWELANRNDRIKVDSDKIKEKK